MLARKKREEKVDSIYDKIQRELDDVASAEQDVRREFAVLNEALITLNYVNKRYGRGVIDVEDLIYHHLLTQDFFDKCYAMGQNQSSKDVAKEESDTERQ